MQNITNEANLINTTEVSENTDAVTETVFYSINPLLDNETSYKDMTATLRQFPEAIIVTGIELKRKSIEIREEKLKAVLGEDYEESEEMKEMDQKYRRPRWNQLGTTEDSKLIARVEMSEGDYCEAFSNGYAHYCNRGRHAIMWIPEYLSESYTYFHPLSDAERQYLTETETVGADMLDDLAWYFTLMMHGEDVIALNLARPRNSSDMQGDEDVLATDKKGNGKSRISADPFPSPEDAYMQKAEWEAQLKVLTDNERVAVILRHKLGYNQTEIAQLIGVKQRSVSRYLQKAKVKMEKAREEFNAEEW